MIRSHFGLRKTPFDHGENCPELLAHQREIFEILQVHAQQGGLCLLLGEPGTGKSVFKHALQTHAPKRLVVPVVTCDAARQRGEGAAPERSEGVRRAGARRGQRGEQVRSRVTYSVVLPRLAPETIEAFILAAFDRAGLGHNAITTDALALIVRSGEVLLRRPRNLVLAALIEAVRDQVRSVDLKQVNRVLVQPHWRRGGEPEIIP